MSAAQHRMITASSVSPAPSFLGRFISFSIPITAQPFPFPFPSHLISHHVSAVSRLVLYTQRSLSMLISSSVPSTAHFIPSHLLHQSRCRHFLPHPVQCCSAQRGREHCSLSTHQKFTDSECNPSASSPALQAVTA